MRAPSIIGDEFDIKTSIRVQCDIKQRPLFSRSRLLGLSRVFMPVPSLLARFNASKLKYERLSKSLETIAD